MDTFSPRHEKRGVRCQEKIIMHSIFLDITRVTVEIYCCKRDVQAGRALAGENRSKGECADGKEEGQEGCQEPEEAVSKSNADPTGALARAPQLFARYSSGVAAASCAGQIGL
jgi:hypothetical protein